MRIETSLADECPACHGVRTICYQCQRAHFPQLRLNVAWLKLIGEALIEQSRRQSVIATAPVSPQQAAHLERKRAARKGNARLIRAARRQAIAA
jgi:hypothetical protein